MPKVILKSSYIKSGNGSGTKNYVNYIGTRDGVEKQVHKYIDYMSNRKGAEKVCNHGLFTSGKNKIVMSKVQEEVGNHKGNIWLPIMSLTREDAIRTGFDNGESWRDLLIKLAPKIADCYKIKIDNFCWYASFHNESHHPHVHMVVYSKNENEGFLTEKGIEKFKSMLTNEIFSHEMDELFTRQTLERDELKAKCKTIFNEIREGDFRLGDCQTNEMRADIIKLKEVLKTTKGKKSYGYLKKKDKELVNKIVANLEKIPSIQESYDMWWETKFEVYRSYTDKTKPKIPLSEQEDFRSIKNMIIKEVNQMNLQPEQNNRANSYNNRVIFNGILNTLNSLEKLFTDGIMKESATINKQIDSKVLSKLIEKKQAKGQKHTGEDLEIAML